MFYPDTDKILLFFNKKHKKYKIFEFENGKTIFIFDHNIIKQICIDNYKSFIKGKGFIGLKKVMGEGLLVSEDPIHIKDRKIISQAFHSSKNEHFEKEIHKVITEIISGWNDIVDVKDQSSFIAFSTTAKVLFSLDFSKEEFKILQKNIYNITDKVSVLSVDESLDGSADIINKIFKEKIDQRIDSEIFNDDLMDLLIKSYNNGEYTKQEVYDHTAAIFLASYETTTSVMSWVIYHLAKYKNWQDLFSKNPDKKYIDAFINEVLRLYPPVWYSERISTEDIKLDDLDIEKGSSIIMCPHVTHRNKDFFDNPDDFIVERWFDMKSLPKGSYFPFLLGRRQCLGRDFALIELKHLILEICKNFELYEDNQKVEPIGELTYKIKNNLNIRIIRRAV